MVPFLVLPRTIPACSSRQPFCFQQLAASLRSFVNALPLFSIACSLFSQNTRVGVPQRPTLRFPRRMLHEAPVSLLRSFTCAYFPSPQGCTALSASLCLCRAQGAP